MQAAGDMEVVYGENDDGHQHYRMLPNRIEDDRTVRLESVRIIGED